MNFTSLVQSAAKPLGCTSYRGAPPDCGEMELGAGNRKLYTAADHLHPVWQQQPFLYLSQSLSLSSPQMDQ